MRISRVEDKNMCLGPSAQAFGRSTNGRPPSKSFAKRFLSDGLYRTWAESNSDWPAEDVLVRFGLGRTGTHDDVNDCRIVGPDSQVVEFGRNSSKRDRDGTQNA